MFFFTKVIQYSSHFSSYTSTVTGKIISYSIDGDKLNLLLKNKEKVQATYYMKNEEEKKWLQETLQIGMVLKLDGKEKEIIGRTIPNTLDYKKYLYRERIYFCFSVSSIEIQNSKIDFFSQIKNKVDKRILFLGDNAYLRAFIIGDKSNMNQKIYENIKENGISHLFALSGMHLSLVYLLLSKLLKKVKGKKIVIYFLLFLYLFVTNFSISFLRAILFMLLFDINKKFDIQLSRIKILFLTANFILLLEPFSIYNAGFWYTFVVTFSLISCGSFFNKGNKFVQIVSISVLTFFFSLPITLYLNYEVNVFSILNNILLVPFISTFVFPLALLSFCFSFFFPLFQFFILLLEKINIVLATFSIPIVFGKINVMEVGIYYLILVVGIEFRKKRMCFLLLFLLLFWYNKNIFVFHSNVYFLDVGQGDASLFIAPQNKEVIMIDTGGSISYSKKEYQKRNKEFDLSDTILLFLKSIRVRKIDLLLLSHGDLDHLGFASAIGKEIPFQSIMINQGKINEEEQKLVQKYNQVTSYTSKFFKFTYYSVGIFDNENDNSILTNIKIKDINFLLMGDASKKIENKLITNFPISATILKVGHHGSNTSSSLEFLKKVNPKYAIISSGRNNLYHHPSKETLENLKQVSSTVLNTQWHGTIKIEINKKGFHIKKTLA